MKKQRKKLKLAKETLDRLAAKDLREMRGGTYTGDAPTLNTCGAKFCVDEPMGPPC